MTAMPQTPPSTAAATAGSLRVWDWPVRLFHWALVAAVGVSVGTGLTGGNAMIWHERSGIFILVLVSFRLLWGFWGGRTARFRDFLRGPRRVWAFRGELFSRRPLAVAGHNPWAGWMVLLLLLMLLFQAGSGLFSNDDIFNEGPFATLVGKAWSDRITGWHKTHVWWLMAAVAGHLGAVVFHALVKREDVVRPMLTGYRPWPGGARPAPVEEFPLRAVATLVAAAAGVWGVLQLAS